MSTDQAIMNELVDMSKEIIALKDRLREAEGLLFLMAERVSELKQPVVDEMDGDSFNSIANAITKVRAFLSNTTNP